MGFLSKKQDTVEESSAPASSAVSDNLMTKKVVRGETTMMVRKSGSGDEFSLIATWGEKDYDLYALVEYVDGHVEVVSCFGTVHRPNEFSLKSSDGAVRHVTGDKTAYSGGTPREVITIKANPRIKCIVPVVYSAKNSGTGSFHRYQVSTYVVRGIHDAVPKDGNTEMVAVEAVNANRDDSVYTFVPAVIHIGREGATIEAVELYSRRGSELRPTVSNGAVTMDSGEENSSK
jgi:hypothetical protein